MTTTIVVKVDNKKLFSWYWCPLLHKHEDQRFVFWGEPDFVYNNPNVKWAKTFSEAIGMVSKGDKDQIVITDQDAVPTYKFMTLVPKTKETRTK